MNFFFSKPFYDFRANSYLASSLPGQLWNPHLCKQTGCFSSVLRFERGRFVRPAPCHLCSVLSQRCNLYWYNFLWLLSAPWWVSPVDMKLAETSAPLAAGEWAACAIAPFCCVIIFQIVSWDKYVISFESGDPFLRLCIYIISLTYL